MNTEIPKLEISSLHDKIQSGQLVIGLSSAIPGFIKKDPAHKAISFAPFYARDSWVKVPIAVIQETIPESNGTLKEHLPLSFALKPGSSKEQILIDLIAALPHEATAQAKGNGASAGEHGMCSRCTMGDDSCVDCFLL